MPSRVCANASIIAPPLREVRELNVRATSKTLYFAKLLLPVREHPNLALATTLALAIAKNGAHTPTVSCDQIGNYTPCLPPMRFRSRHEIGHPRQAQFVTTFREDSPFALCHTTILHHVPRCSPQPLYIHHPLSRALPRQPLPQCVKCRCTQSADHSSVIYITLSRSLGCLYIHLPLTHSVFSCRTYAPSDTTNHFTIAPPRRRTPAFRSYHR